MLFQKGHIPWSKGKKLSEIHKKRLSESKKTGKFMICEICGKEFWVIKFYWNTRKYCSQKCYMKICKIRMKKLGLKNKKYATQKEKHQANLASGRKCYRKHIKKRLFYYRQLSYKRRNALGKHTLYEWENLKKKYNYCCIKCGMQEPFSEQYYQKLTEDHIMPISKGGTNYIENIQPLCWNCNSKKWSKVNSKITLNNFFRVGPWQNKRISAKARLTASCGGKTGWQF